MVKKGERPTLKSIAEHTGLTTNTVSLALRNSPLVAPETKKRIKEAARELGYVHNVLAGSLRSGRSYTVAVVFGDVSNQLFAIKIGELETLLRKKGYQLLILNTYEDEAIELRAIKTAVSRHVDGVVLCPCQKSRESVAMLEQYGLPYVLSGRYFDDLSADSVVWDDKKGGYLAARHLLDRGCRRVLMLNGPSEISSARERAQGYRQALEEAGAPPLIRSVSSLAGGVYEALDALRAEGADYDGLFAFSDLIAFEAACYLQERGAALPGGVRMVGFDDILSHVRIPFGLSSVSADKKDEMACVVELLLDQIEAKAPRESVRRVLDVKLVERESSR